METDTTNAGPDFLTPRGARRERRRLRGLVAALPDLNRLLEQVDQAAPLETATQAQDVAVVELFGLRDTLKVPGTRLTKLSKILHCMRRADSPVRRAHSLLRSGPRGLAHDAKAPLGAG